MNGKMNFGIVGCGMIARIHARAITGIPDANLVGAADVIPEAAERFAAEQGIRAYKSYELLLRDPDIDAVCICTPSGCHASDALLALDAGKHVVLEKPMALSAEDARRVQDAAKASGRLLTVISQLRFCEDVAKVRGMIRDGAFGRLVFCSLRMHYWRDPSYYMESSWKGTRRLDGGALMNQGIHGVDLLLYMAGNARVLKGKVKTRFHAIEAEDTAAALLEFESGALGTLEASTCTKPGLPRRMEFLGDRGFAAFRENRIEKMVVDDEVLCDRVVTEDDVGSARDASALSSEPHARQIANLMRASRGEEQLLVDAAEGGRAVKLIEDIYRSSQNESY